MNTRSVPTTTPTRTPAISVRAARSRLAQAESTLAAADADTERCEITIWARGGLGSTRCSERLVGDLFAAHLRAYRATLNRNHAAQLLADAITTDATGDPTR